MTTDHRMKRIFPARQIPEIWGRLSVSSSDPLSYSPGPQKVLEPDYFMNNDIFMGDYCMNNDIFMGDIVVSVSVFPLFIKAYQSPICSYNCFFSNNDESFFTYTQDDPQILRSRVKITKLLTDLNQSSEHICISRPLFVDGFKFLL